MLQGTAKKKKKKDFFLNEEDKTPDLRSSEFRRLAVAVSWMGTVTMGEEEPRRAKEANCTPLGFRLP